VWIPVTRVLRVTHQIFQSGTVVAIRGGGATVYSSTCKQDLLSWKGATAMRSLTLNLCRRLQFFQHEIMVHTFAGVTQNHILNVPITPLLIV
jgi:hypothetical protein